MKHKPNGNYSHLHHERYHYHYGLLHRTELLAVEAVMALLVIVSLVTLLFTYLLAPTPSQQSALWLIDIVIAGLLLIEFMARLALSRHKKHYLRHNWWYLFAGIPVATPIATLLRALRILGFIKMLKIGIHLKLEADLLEEIEEK